MEQKKNVGKENTAGGGRERPRSPVTGRYMKAPKAAATGAGVSAGAPVSAAVSVPADTAASAPVHNAPAKADVGAPAKTSGGGSSSPGGGASMRRIIIASILSVIFAVGIALGIYLMIPKNHTVKFFGLEDTVINEINVRGRKKIKQDDIPGYYISVKETEGYLFTGWYTEIARIHQFDIGKQKVKRNIGLYGEFMEIWAAAPELSALTYNGAPQAPPVAAGGSFTVGFYYDEACTREIPGGAAKDAGVYYAKFSLTNPAMIKWIGGKEEDIVREWSIVPAPLTVTAVSGQRKEYGEGGPAQLAYTAQGWQGGDSAAVLTGELVRETGENAGTYEIGQGSLDAGGNYTIGYTGAVFTIAKAALTVTVTPGQSKVYGGADPDFDYTVSGWKTINGVSDELNASGILTGALSRAQGQQYQNVGAYAIQKGSLAIAGGNYTLVFIGADFTIAGISLTGGDLGVDLIAAAISPVQYNGSAHTPAPGVTYKGTALIAGVDFDYGYADNTNAGAAKVTITFKGNYSGAAAVNFTITKAVLTVTAIPYQSKTFGDSDPAFTLGNGYTAGGLFGGDTVSGALGRAAGEGPGLYAFNIGGVSAGVNYTVNFIGADFEILETGAVAKIGNPTDRTYNGTKQTPAIQANAGYDITYYNDLACTDQITGAANAGAYYAKLTLNPGYSWNGGAAANAQNFIVLTWKIVKAELTVTVKPGQAKAYNDSDPAFTQGNGYTVGGLFGGDTVTGTLNRAAGEAAGFYAFNTGTVSAGDNYTVNFIGENFEIKKADRSAVLATMTLTAWAYGGTAGAPGLSDTPEESPTVKYYYDTSKNGAFALTAQPADAGAYWVRAVISETTNYKAFTTEAISFTVTKAIVAKPSAPAAQTYTGGPLLPDIAADSRYTASVTARTNAGSYSATVSLNSQNYQWDDETASSFTLTWVIEKVKVTAPFQTGGDIEFTYDGTEKRPEIDTNANYSITGNRGTNAGDYTASVSLDDPANHEWASGGTAAVTLAWKIKKAQVAVPAASGMILELAYNGHPQGPSVPSSPYYSIAGVTTGINAGTYAAKLSLINKANYEWEDKTTDDIAIGWEITVLKLEKASVTSFDFVYNATDRSPTIATSVYYSITGDTLKRNAGDYSVTVKLTDANAVWSDGTTGDLSLPWSILKADRANAVKLAGWTFGGAENNPEILGAIPDGATPVYYYDISAAGAFASAVKPTAAGTYYVRAEIAGGVNYNALTTAAVMFIIAPENTTPRPTPSLNASGRIELVYNGGEQNPNSAAALIAENANYTITYYEEYECENEITGATNTGVYYAKVSFISTDYEWNDGGSGDIVFTWEIVRADRTNTVTLADWFVDASTVPDPSVGGVPDGAAVTYYYDTKSAAEGGTFVSTIKPAAAGTYWVLAKIAQGANYNALTTAEVSFKIKTPEYSITFVYNDGAKTSQSFYTYKTVVYETVPVKAGYTFLGWYSDNGTFEDEIEWPHTMTGDITVYADWEINVLSVRYEYGNGDSDVDITADYDAYVTLPSPSREGYMFAGWKGGKLLTGTTGSKLSQDIWEGLENANGSVILQAQWVSYNLTVVYDANGGGGAMTDSGAPYSGSVTVKANAFTPPDGTLTFREWNTQAGGYGVAVSGQTMSQLWNLAQYTNPETGDRTLTLYAKWDTIFELEALITRGGDPSNAQIAGLKTGAVAPADLIIPETVFSWHTGAYAEYAVKAVKANAFNGNTDIVTVTVGGGVAEIGAGAFAGCSNLEEITLPFIGQSAEENQFLGWIFGAVDAAHNGGNVPASVKTVTLTQGAAIPANAFFGCAGVLTFNLPDTLASIGASAFEGCAGITSVNSGVAGIILENAAGLISIGASAFAGCTSLIKVNLYDTGVAAVPYRAFLNCGSLNEFSFKTGTASIGISAFEGCASLDLIEIPAGMKTIGASAFYNCSALKEIDLTATGVTIIEPYTFVGCESLKDVYLSADTEEIRSHAFWRCAALETIDIPSNVNFIGGHAFSDCIRLKEIDLQSAGSKDLAIVSESAFEGCVSLAEVIFPENLSKIENRAFAGCAALTGLAIPLIIPNNDVAFGGEIFAGGGLARITMPFTDANYAGLFSGLRTDIELIFYAACPKDAETSLPAAVSLSDYAFKNFDGTLLNNLPNLTYIELPQDLEGLGQRVFSGCAGLTSIVIPDSVTEMGINLFENSGIDTVVMPLRKENINYQNIFRGFAENAELTLTLTQTGVTGLKDNSFDGFDGRTNGGNPKLVSIILPENLETIGNYAFLNCIGITDIVIYNALNDIGAGAFEGCSSLIEIKLDETGILEIKSNTFRGCAALLRVFLPDGTYSIGDDAFYSIGDYAFYNCGNLNGIDIPSNVDYIGEYAFFGCGELREIDLSLSGALGLSVVSASAFENCVKLWNVTLPSNLSKIDNRAFAGCTALTSLVIPNNNVVFGSAIFAAGSGTLAPGGLKTITMPFTTDANAVTAEGERYAGLFSGLRTELSVTFTKLAAAPPTALTAGAFGYFDGTALNNLPELIYIELPDNLASIGNEAFRGCSSLGGTSEMVIPAAVTSMGSMVFADCAALKTIVIPDGVTSMGANLFKNSGLTSVTMPLRDVDYPGIFTDLTNDITLTLTQTEVTAIPNNAFANFRGAEKHLPNLIVINLPENLEKIGNAAFQNCTGITAITIHETVKDIGASAFEACSELASINLENNVSLTEIKESTFEGCYMLSSVRLPEVIAGIGGINSIGDRAFYGCGSLTDIHIPSNVDYIGEYAFYNCVELTSIDLSNVFQTAVNSVISVSAFEGCAKLEAVHFPLNLSEICNRAFAGCTILQYLIIPDNDIVFDAQIFAGSGLKKITMPFTDADYAALFNGLTTSLTISFYAAPYYYDDYSEVAAGLSENAFLNFDGAHNMPRLVDITLPVYLETIGASAFEGCSGLGEGNKAILIPDLVTDIPQRAFYGCSSLQTAVLSAATESIGISAFAYSGLVTVNNINQPSLAAIGARAFEGAKLVNLDLSLTEIPIIDVYTFAECRNLKTIALPDGILLTEIGSHAFYNCRVLESVLTDSVSKLPASIGALGDSVFENCFMLKLLDMSGTSVERIGENAFSGCKDLESLKLPSTVKYIESNAFNGCSSLSALNLWTVSTVSETAFLGSGLSSVTMPYYDFNYAALFQGNGNNLTLTFTSGPQKTVKNNTFANFNGTNASGKILPNLVSITLPGDITAVGDNAFLNCKGLAAFNIPTGGALSSIGNYAFSGCSNLKTIDVPYGTGTIGSYAFNASGLTEINLTNTLVTSIGAGVFNGCAALGTTGAPGAAVLLNAGTSGIGASAFQGCSKLTAFNFGLYTGLNSIGISAFEGSGLTAADLSGTAVSAVAASAFKDAESLVTVTLRNTSNSAANITSSIDSYAFQNCKSLLYFNSLVSGEVDLAATNVTVIGAGVFAGCAKITKVSLNPSTSSIGGSAFLNCAALNVINLYSVASIGSSAFQNCGSLAASTALPAGLSSIGASAFQGSSLATVSINAETISASAFQGCTSLASVTIGPAVKTIGESAFQGCTSASFTTVALPGVETLGGSAFQGCSNLASITLNSALKTIGNYAFAGTKISVITIPASAAALNNSVGNDIFSGCVNNLTVQLPLGDYINANIFRGFANDLALEIGAGGAALPDNAFLNLACLVSVVLPGGMTAIGDGAFSGCTGLTGLSIPGTVAAIGDSAFSGCTGFTSIGAGVTAGRLNLPAGGASLTLGASVFAGSGIVNADFTSCPAATLPANAFRNCAGLNGVTFGNITKIESMAFSGCASLASLTIPAQITAIGSNAFSGCSSLSTLNLERTAAPVTAGSGSGIRAEAKIFVYNVVLGDYRTEWPDFAGQIFPRDPVLTFNSNGGSAGPAANPGNNVTNGPKPADPIKANYTFGGWYFDPALTAPVTTWPHPLYDSITMYAKWNPALLTITWLDGDGITLKTDQVAYGDTPSYSGATPTKTSTEQYAYTFNGTWSPAVVSVTGAATYTAQFDQEEL